MKEIDASELAKCDGKDGNPVYVAHEGKVFDVTESKAWKGGVHMFRHHAGGDLTADIEAAPHGVEMLERYPQVAVLKTDEKTSERKMPESLSLILGRFPMLRRHPHPMTVHFPIVFMFSVSVFTILYLVTGTKAWEITALHCLGAGLFFTPLAMATGYYTWWLNYMARPLRPVRIKQRLSIVLLIVQCAAFAWRMTVPDILCPFGPASGVYLLLVLAVLPMVTVIGWYGASLTFPIARE
jgi:predicted heme/steroid binding protein/uncharacterized membrane protein